MLGNQHPPGLMRLVGRLTRTGLGAVHNRLELLTVEWQEEKGRLLQLWIWGAGCVILAIAAVLLGSALIISLFSPDARIYVAAGFVILYALGAVGASVVVRSLLKRQPFQETIAQGKKDRAWLESSN